MSSQVILASTKWTGGNAIQLIEKIHSVVLQSKNNYKKILDTLHTLFSSSELEKTKIIQEAQSQVEEATLFFKTKRSQANKQVVRIRKSIFEIAQDRRVKKLEYLRALGSNDDVQINRIQYIDDMGQTQYLLISTYHTV